MDLTKGHELSDKLFDLDKSTGDLAKGIVEVKDFLAASHKDFIEKESKLKDYETKIAELEDQKSKLIAANGEMLMRIPIKQEQPTYTNPYQKQQPEASGIETLLGGINIT
jgi:glucose dehydrogenase